MAKIFERIKDVSQRAALTAAATGALVVPGIAQAETAPVKGSKPNISHKQKLRNEQAQGRLNKLAKLIMRGPAAHHGGEKDYTNALTGKRFGVAGADVQSSSLYSDEPGRYSFRVTAPLDTRGKLRLGKTMAVSMTEGDTTNRYASLTFTRGDYGAVRFYGDYVSPKGTLSDITSIEASTLPSSSKEARLTPTRLLAATHQAAHTIHAAEVLEPTGVLPPAFTQPHGTYAGMK